MNGAVGVVKESVKVKAALLQAVPAPVENLLDRGTHAALIFQNGDEKYSFLAPLFNAGGRNKEKIVLCLHAQQESEALFLLEQFGCPARQLKESGGLSVIDARSFFYPQGRFGVDAALASHRQVILDAFGGGYTNVRFAVDMGWVMSMPEGAEQFIEYEARSNYFSRALGAITICCYQQGLFSKELLFNVMQTHPSVIKQGMTGANPYYLDPGVFLASESASIASDALRKLSAVKGENRTIQRVRVEFREGMRRFNLTAQELRVVEMILRFQSNQDISRDLYISINTVKQHIKNIYRKMKINKRMELIAQFMKLLEAE